MSNHEEVRELLSAAALGELDEAQQRQVDEHLATCEACRNELMRMEEVLKLAGQLRQDRLEDDIYRQARESVLGMVADLEARQRRRVAWIKYAAAAVLILGAWVVLQHFMGQQKMPEPPRAGRGLPAPRVTPEGTTPEKPDAARLARVESQQRLAQQLFEARDMQGLAELYRTGEPETKQAVIDYLSRIGSAEALRTLDQLQAAEPDNQNTNGTGDEPPAEQLPQGIVPVLPGAAHAAEPVTLQADNIETTSPAEPVTGIAAKVSQQEGGRIELSEYRLRMPGLFREDHFYQTVIDDGRRRLTLNHQDRTARFSPSHHPSLQQHEAYQYATLFRAEKPDGIEWTELTAMRDAKTRVYDVRGLNPDGLVRAWMDAESRLMRKFSGQLQDPNDRVEVIFDYAPLDDSVFAMQIPEGYTELEEQVPGTFTGYVVDGDGRPVPGAKVFVKAWPVLSSKGPLEGVTDTDGRFTVPIEPGRMPSNQDSLGSPIVIWAQLPDRPDLIAWTILQNEYDRQWRAHSEQIVNREAIVQVSENYQNGPYEWCRGASNLVLIMEPAGWVTGTVVDPQGVPLADAEVRIGFTPAGQNGQTPGAYMDFWQTTVQTNASGRFEAGCLPMLWKQSRLEFFLKANGYVQSMDSITLQEPLEILETTFAMLPQGATVRGCVRDNYGTPLTNRTVSIAVPGQNISGCSGTTNADGFFEIAGCPAGVDMKAGAVLDHNPASPNPRNTNQDPFVYYPNASEWIAGEPARSVYDVNIVAVLPELVVEVEVTDSQGLPLKDFPLEITSRENPLSPFWKQDAGLIGLTDEQGRITFTRVPEVEGLIVAGPLGVHFPKPNELAADFRRRFDQAVGTCGQYGRMEVPVELTAGQKAYFVQMNALTPLEKIQLRQAQLQEQSTPR